MKWKPANDPPETTPGNWSREVIVFTNYGDVFQLCYSGTKEEGTWQRPTRFNKGEQVAWWIDKPEEAEKIKTEEDRINFLANCSYKGKW